MQSCGSPIFNILIVDTPGFSAFAGITKVFEPAAFLPVVTECGEGQSVQPISLRQCSPRRKLLRSSLPAWQERHVSAVSFDDLFLKEMILVGSPSAMWFFPGPWQASPPVTLPFQLLIFEKLACAVFGKAFK